MRLLCIVLFLVSFPALAQVDARVAFLTRQLEKGKDPRARSQAALVLGATDEPDAMGPLCTALKDESEVVRSAAAKGLATLKEVAALDCLKAHKEEDAATLVAVREAIQGLEALKSRPPRIYVDLEDLKDKTGALPPDLLKATQDRLKRRLLQSGALLAPRKEPKKTAKGVLKKHGISGYRLSAEVRTTEEGGLRIVVVCLTYPDLALLGQVDVQASGAQPADLLKALAPKVIEEVAATLEWST
ncbi:HEAT repeat domain-containing protein [Hyalangium rubrum]|uniref:HEAT repeat domain-containing protein n=1 Tax=Hyalangium rubrum TaxID=3103134 RepID=A0ABU5H4Q1_9BACT|nr:HEAT repeat domain-containing protein [Hyalangium sp. s54d21]MDY7228438.1 HEAT repeat domain-containing protein [Hyalangium sp. s54d21]